MKILMIGLGSIGQRHLRNIRRLYGDETEILAYRVRGSKTTFSDSMQIRENVDVEKEYNITSYTLLSEALAQKPDIAFICNVTKAHIPCALEAARTGCHLFIEKPLSDSFSGVDELVRIAEEKNVKIFVGFQNRYNPALLKLKEYLVNGVIGNIISVHVQVGERLSTMHSYEDFRTTYMARSDLGGGLILNQMIHEIDYLRFLFSDPESLYAAGNMLSENLNIDVDDCCDVIMKYDNFNVALHGDFYQYPPSREITVIGTEGKINADIINNKVMLFKNDTVHTDEFKDFRRNDMFAAELKSFISCIENNNEPEIGIEAGIGSLKIASAIKRSMTEKKEIEL